MGCPMGYPMGYLMSSGILYPVGWDIVHGVFRGISDQDGISTGCPTMDVRAPMGLSQQNKWMVYPIGPRDVSWMSVQPRNYPNQQRNVHHSMGKVWSPYRYMNGPHSGIIMEQLYPMAYAPAGSGTPRGIQHIPMGGGTVSIQVSLWETLYPMVYPDGTGFSRYVPYGKMG